jgi:hypothetical protein
MKVRAGRRCGRGIASLPRARSGCAPLTTAKALSLRSFVASAPTYAGSRCRTQSSRRSSTAWPTRTGSPLGAPPPFGRLALAPPARTSSTFPWRILSTLGASGKLGAVHATRLSSKCELGYRPQGGRHSQGAGVHSASGKLCSERQPRAGRGWRSRPRANRERVLASARSHAQLIGARIALLGSFVVLLEQSCVLRRLIPQCMGP